MCIRIYIFDLKQKQKEIKTKQDDKKTQKKKREYLRKI